MAWGSFGIRVDCTFRVPEGPLHGHRVRQEISPELLAITTLSRAESGAAPTLLRRDETVKRGTKAKQKMVGWDDDHRLHLLTLGVG